MYSYIIKFHLLHWPILLLSNTREWGDRSHFVVPHIVQLTLPLRHLITFSSVSPYRISSLTDASPRFLRSSRASSRSVSFWSWMALFIAWMYSVILAESRNNNCEYRHSATTILKLRWWKLIMSHWILHSIFLYKLIYLFNTMHNVHFMKCNYTI